jgi:hypothetical protein
LRKFKKSLIVHPHPYPPPSRGMGLVFWSGDTHSCVSTPLKKSPIPPREGTKGRGSELLQKSLFLLLAAYFLFCLFSPASHAEVIVHDSVVRTGEEVMLEAETKGRFFRKGGEKVEFLIEGRHAGKTLSGGDGFAYRNFVPTRQGLFKIHARSGKEEGSGLLLSLKKGRSVVFIDAEGTLFSGLLSGEPREGSRKAVAVINKKFPIVVLQTGLLSASAIKAWLTEHKFPELPVIPWDQGRVFDGIAEKGLRIKAVVAGRDVVESSRKYKPSAFSFEDTEDSEEVKDWEEIRRRLR